MKTARLAIAPLIALLVVAVFGVADASSKVRSPQLESSCPAGFTYGEFTNGPWRVEGCANGAEPRGDEVKRVLLSGTVEVNGMLIEGSNNLIAYASTDVAHARQAITNAQTTTYGIKRSGPGTKIVIDQAGTNQRDEIYHGAIEMEIGAKGTIQDTTGYKLDIPTDSNAKINGMRLREAITDATLKRGGSQQTLTDEDLRPREGRSSAVVQTSNGTIEFKGKLSFASSASALLRDWTSPSKFKLVDGEGLQTDNVKFKLDTIVVPGIGGFNDLSIKYYAARDEWVGTVDLDLGDLFPELEFEMTVDGTTGAIVRIEAKVTGLRVPIGNTGATLREISGFFEPSPLVFGGGAGATYGPKIGNFYLVEITGTLRIELEPNFRLEAGGAARVLATGPNSQLARGSSKVTIDSSGLLAVEADAQISVDIGGGIGAEANARGSGAFSTKNSRFNIEAAVSGELHLGFLGDFTVARIEAVISSDGWGTCAQLLEFIKGGIGQQWDGNIKVFTGCDLSDFRVPINTSAAAAGQKQFIVGSGVDKINVEINGEGPEPRAALIDPSGTPVAATTTLGKREVSNKVSVIALAGQSQQIIGVKNPKAGIWKVAWGAQGPAVSSIRVARSLDPLDANVTVRDAGAPGARAISVTGLKNIDSGEKVVFGVKTPKGIVPIGDTTGDNISTSFVDQDAGARKIVAIPYRNGIPNPERMRILGSYTSRMPGAASGLKTKRKGSSLKVTATLRKGALKPTGWIYVLRVKGRPVAAKSAKPGKSVKFTIPTGAKKLSVAARPIVAGRVLKVAQRTKTVR